MAKRGQRKAPGPGVDASGQPVVDPTANVLQLVDAESLRQDGLRQAEGDSVRREIALRAEYDEKLRKAESARIDAIRAVDVGQVQRAAEVQATAALALQAQVVASAEAVRAQLAVTNTSFTESLALTNKNLTESMVNSIKPLADAIGALQAQQWQDSGRTAGQRQQVVEQRDVRGSSRLDVSTMISLAVAVLAVVAYLTK